MSWAAPQSPEIARASGTSQSTCLANGFLVEETAWNGWKRSKCKLTVTNLRLSLCGLKKGCYKLPDHKLSDNHIYNLTSYHIYRTLVIQKSWSRLSPALLYWMKLQRLRRGHGDPSYPIRRFHELGYPQWLVYIEKSHLSGLWGSPIFRKPPTNKNKNREVMWFWPWNTGGIRSILQIYESFQATSGVAWFIDCFLELKTANKVICSGSRDVVES